MTSTAVLQEHGQDGGTVRIVCPGYPPDADTQAKAAAEMVKVCSPRLWRIVDIHLQDLHGPSGIACAGDSCGSTPGTRDQQVDLKFVCVSN
jgi:hypothetical protein